MIDTMSIDCKLFGEHDWTAKLVLILREYKWAGALLVWSRRGKDVWVVTPVPDTVRRMGLQRLRSKPDHEPSITDLKNQVVVEL